MRGFSILSQQGGKTGERRMKRLLSCAYIALFASGTAIAQQTEKTERNGKFVHEFVDRGNAEAKAIAEAQGISVGEATRRLRLERRAPASNPPAPPRAPLTPFQSAAATPPLTARCAASAETCQRTHSDETVNNPPSPRTALSFYNASDARAFNYRISLSAKFALAFAHSIRILGAGSKETNHGIGSIG